MNEHNDSPTITTDSLIRLNDLIQNEVAFYFIDKFPSKREEEKKNELKSQNEMYELNGVCVCVLVVNLNRFSASQKYGKRDSADEERSWFLVS